MRKDKPRGYRQCTKCHNYREHYKNTAYCIECWRKYAPLKKAKRKYDRKKRRTPPTSGLHLLSERSDHAHQS